MQINRLSSRTKFLVPYVRKEHELLFSHISLNGFKHLARTEMNVMQSNLIIVPELFQSNRILIGYYVMDIGFGSIRQTLRTIEHHLLDSMSPGEHPLRVGT